MQGRMSMGACPYSFPALLYEAHGVVYIVCKVSAARRVPNMTHMSICHHSPSRSTAAGGHNPSRWHSF
jgi:hypothetical protein